MVGETDARLFEFIELLASGKDFPIHGCYCRAEFFVQLNLPMKKFIFCGVDFLEFELLTLYFCLLLLKLLDLGLSLLELACEVLSEGIRTAAGISSIHF